MEYVRTLNDIITNITTLENYLTTGSKSEKEFAGKLIANGETFVVYKVEGVNHFAPSMFCAFASNKQAKYKVRDEEEMKDANKKVNKIVGKDAFSNNIMETNFKAYCSSIGIKVPANTRNYWRLYEGGSYLEL